MPTYGRSRNHREQAKKLNEYKIKLISKGVDDGTRKIQSLLCKFASKHF